MHHDPIATKGLIFVYDQHMSAGEALLLRWSMLTPSGDIAGRGADIIHQDTHSRVETAYMFTGVN